LEKNNKRNIKDMKKHLTIITMAAVAILTACSSSENTNTATVAVQDEKPKVKLAASTVEEVEQLAEFTTTVEAEVKNNIAPNAPLRIEKILVEVGDNVSKGQKLVQLDASGLEQMALQIENQKIEFNRVNELYKVGGASKAELDNVKTALDVNIKAYNNKLENTVMRSPINGVVTARNYDNGDMSGAAPILVVEQIAPVKMHINVSEPYYAKVTKKTEVSVKFEAYGEEEFAASVNIVYPTINATTHTFPVELNIANKDRLVRPGMYGRATVNFGTQRHVVVPDQAVINQLESGDY
jgi:RND family efflux transporter MFP subunit